MAPQEPSLPVKLLTAGSAACVADLITFPLDTAKVRLQIQGELTGAANKLKYWGAPPPILTTASGTAILTEQGARAPVYRGMVGTVMTVARQEGPKALYNGLVAGLQRQMAFAGIRIGLYDSIKAIYQKQLDQLSGRRINSSGQNSANIPVRIMAGITTGGLAVLFAQPTDVVKVRMQAQVKKPGGPPPRYTSAMMAYKTIAKKEGMPGLWKGTLPNVARNAIVNVAEIVCYDVFKDYLLANWMKDGVPCHFTAAVMAGFCTTVVASPVDVVKTRFMNSRKGEYRGAIEVAVRMLVQEGPTAFYKGFVPSFSRLVSWNICMWITYEQFKKLVLTAYNEKS